jgi:hypothetical protein
VIQGVEVFFDHVGRQSLKSMVCAVVYSVIATAGDSPLAAASMRFILPRRHMDTMAGLNLGAVGVNTLHNHALRIRISLSRFKGIPL